MTYTCVDTTNSVMQSQTSAFRLTLPQACDTDGSLCNNEIAMCIIMEIHPFQNLLHLFFIVLFISSKMFFTSLIYYCWYKKQIEARSHFFSILYFLN